MAEASAVPLPSGTRLADGRWVTRALDHGLWLAFGGVGLVAILVYEAIVSEGLRDVAYSLIGLIGAVGVLVGVRLNRPALPRPWILMGVGQLLWVAGDLIATVMENVFGVYAYPSVADLFYLAGYPVLAWGIHLLVRGRRSRADVAGMLDSATVTAGVGLLSWVVIARPTIIASEDSLASAMVSVAYPLADILLVGGLVLLLTTPGGGRSVSLRMMLSALALLIVADSMYAAGSLYGDGTDNKALDALWLASYVLWGMAALHPSMRDLSKQTEEQELTFRRLRVASLCVATLVAPGVLAVQHAMGLRLDVWPVVVGSVVMFVLVVGRMNFAIDQISAMNRQREQLQAELAHQALHDSLTGLPNRAQAMRLLKGALARSQRSRTQTALLFIDLDAFKSVNDTYGHRAGDELLCVIAQRMRSEIRDGDGDVAARLGGDEFLVIINEVGREASAVGVAERLIGAISQPVTLEGGVKASVGASIGVAVGSTATTDPESLLHDADIAVYRAKSRGKGRVEVYDAAAGGGTTPLNDLEQAITQAIANDEFVLFYQPVVDVRSGDLRGFEALIRWQRPGVGFVPPSEFVPAAEASNLICDLDTWVLRKATQQLASWIAGGASPQLKITVNISGRHLAMARIRTDVGDALRAAGLEPRQLVLEITETYLNDDRVASHNLRLLRDLGVLLSLDDFGTGYNSIARLATLPIDVVKIDKSYVDTRSESARTLLRLMVHAAHQVGLLVIGEGVERPDQLTLLQEVGCEFAQGYFLGRPMSAPDLELRLKNSLPVTAVPARV